MQPHELPTILMVDDNEDDFDAAVRSFRKADLDNPVQWCKDGREALDYLKRSSATLPGLVLLDLNMPGLDGRRTLSLIKHEEAWKCIPVVIFTTSKAEKDIDHCYAEGASTYLQKPVDFQNLVDTAKLIKQYWFSLAKLPNSVEMPVQ
jgi:two-component system response regulator